MLFIDWFEGQQLLFTFCLFLQTWFSKTIIFIVWFHRIPGRIRICKATSQRKPGSSARSTASYGSLHSRCGEDWGDYTYWPHDRLFAEQPGKCIRRTESNVGGLGWVWRGPEWVSQSADHKNFPHKKIKANHCNNPLSRKNFENGR